MRSDLPTPTPFPVGTPFGLNALSGIGCVRTDLGRRLARVREKGLNALSGIGCVRTIIGCWIVARRGFLWFLLICSLATMLSGFAPARGSIFDSPIPTPTLLPRLYLPIIMRDYCSGPDCPPTPTSTPTRTPTPTSTPTPISINDLADDVNDTGKYLFPAFAAAAGLVGAVAFILNIIRPTTR